MVFENERDYVGVHNHRSGGIDRRWIHLQLDRAGVRLTKLADQGHELFRTFRVVFGVFFQIIDADGRQEHKAPRQPCPARCRFGALSFLRHLVYQFTAGLPGERRPAHY